MVGEECEWGIEGWCKRTPSEEVVSFAVKDRGVDDGVGFFLVGFSTQLRLVIRTESFGLAVGTRSNNYVDGSDQSRLEQSEGKPTSINFYFIQLTAPNLQVCTY